MLIIYIHCRGRKNESYSCDRFAIRYLIMTSWYGIQIESLYKPIKSSFGAVYLMRIHSFAKSQVCTLVRLLNEYNFQN